MKQNNPDPVQVTRLLNRKDKAHKKARDSANDCTKSIRRAKHNFYDTINNTLKNPEISAKKKFSILLKLMKNNKFSNVPPLIENNSIIQNPLEQSNIFNKFFAPKSAVQNQDDPVPILKRREGISLLTGINTSPTRFR